MAQRTATLPGVDFHDDELTELALCYAEARDDRMAKGKIEVEFKWRLLERMIALKLTSYHDDERNLSIVLESTTTVKVKITDGPDDDND